MLMATGCVSILITSCALIGKAPKSVVDFRKSKYGENSEKIWSERYVVTGTTTAADNTGRIGYFIKPDWEARREDISFTWPKGHPEIKLQPNTRYRLNMITHFRKKRDSSGVRTYGYSEVERIETPEGVTLFNASHCPVHRCDMRWDWEKAGSNEDYFNTPFFTIREKKFPHDGREYLACGSGYYRQKRWICRKCETACDQTVKKLGITRY